MAEVESQSVDGAGGSLADGLADAGRVGHAIVQVARLHKSLAAQLLKPVGLHLSQELVMMQLWDAGPQRQADLVRMLGSDAATITRTIRRLEHAGFVRTAPSPTDGRSVIVTATTASKGLRPGVEAAWRELEEAVVADLDPGEQEQAIELLGRIAAGLERGIGRRREA
ncbi:MarR family winged helix-turn-helix transcriptional regulator [Arthrobacter sp. NPDC090010]|uniref:MarR family winged helix-turn-helix transcriptional regulator n=1 Tax=Arthrobacter sp. NPDC090010 TaxID=3363942 RepID=UPI00381D5F21